MGNQEKVVTLG